MISWTLQKKHFEQGLCRQDHLGFAAAWHLGGGNHIVNIGYGRNISRWGLGVSPSSPGAGLWTQLLGLPDRLALGACRSRPLRQLPLVTGGITPNESSVVDTVNLETQLGGLVQSSTAAEEHWWHKTHAPWHLRLGLVRSSWRRTGTPY